MSWYAGLGFEQNPLSIKPSKNFELFFDDKSLVEDIIGTINKKENLVLTGALGTGKTSVLKKIIKSFGGDKKLYYYNAFSASSPLDFEKVIQKSGGFFSKMFNIRSRGLILFIDEASHLAKENIKEIKNYLGSYFNSVILASSDPNYQVPEELVDKFNKKINSGNFTENDAYNIIKNRLGEENYKDILGEKDIKLIYRKSKTPREFLIKCDQFCHKKYDN